MMTRPLKTALWIGALAYVVHRYHKPANVFVGEMHELAERMLGVVTHPHRTALDELAIDVATDLGYGATFRPSRVGIFFGDEPGKTVPDPFFGGEGPPRTGCIECGNCLLGCKYGAKNHTNKNYLWLAQRHGVRIEPERLVTDIQPLGARDGSEGYAVVTCAPGSLTRRPDLVLRAHGVVVTAGAIGTNVLLANCKANGSLPALSAQLGKQVRSNAESIGAVTSRDPNANYAKSVTLTGSVFPKDDVHLEAATYGTAGDTFGLNFVPLTGDGTRLTRPMKLARNVLRHPLDFLRAAQPVGLSRRTVYVAAMQETDAVLSLRAKRRRLGRGVKLTTQQDPDNPNPTFIPELNEFLERLAERMNGIAQSWASEALANIPVTAHLLGGAVVATSPDKGVVDPSHRVFGYENLLVCDGSTLPYNPGYNPSLTITAMAERAMSLVPPKASA